jgi:hypothetical protein
MESELDNEVSATNKNKTLQKKLERKPAPEPEKSVGDPAEQDSLLKTGLKRMQTVSDAVKTKANMAEKDKINDVVASRKQVSSGVPDRTVAKTPSTKKVTEKAISLKK